LQAPAEIAAQQKRGYPEMVPAMLVAVAPDDLRIEAPDTTLLSGFKDDMVIGVTASGSGSRVDARSLSRIGGSDFGTNAKRIRTFLRQLDAAKEGS
jgi:uncharacterized protein (DUF1499 family)